MKKTFLEWVKQPKKEIRPFRSSKACYLCDLNGKILKEFNNLFDCARYLRHSRNFAVSQYNSCCIVNGKYRVFTINYYLENKVEILKLKNYTCETKLKNKIRYNKNIILCDLHPNEEFIIKSLSDRISKHIETIRLILKGKILKNDYNIRYKYPELQNLDVRHRNKVIKNENSSS